MANRTLFQPAFDTLATNGVIGDPNGQFAYAYIRVSSDDQADEGRSGLPRQIQHIHEVAREKGYKISWDLVYADDHTGFAFEDRPALSTLRNELQNPLRRANAVVIEHLDRLSRNAVWHQGFLIEEMESAGVTLIFWKEFGSLIERTVLGVVAQQGMEQEKRRMMEGNLHKARSGRVTARVAAYGYRLVDADGNEGLRAKKESYYAIHEEEAAVVRQCFTRLLRGDALRRIAHDLELSGVPPPKKYKHWESAQVRLFITSEVYKGDFYAHRWHHTTVEKPAKNGIGTRKVKCKVQRPREEWIHVPVPAIVSDEVWEAANHMLEQNKKTSRRNAKEPYLLTGLITCAHCGWRFCGTTSRKSRGKKRKTTYRGYRCTYSSTKSKIQRKDGVCKNSQIRCDVLDTIVWNIVCQALLEPQILLDALDEDATSQRNTELTHQITYLEQQLEAKHDDDDKLFRAYMAGAFDETEYAARRKILQDERTGLVEECSRLRAQVLTPEQLDHRKEVILQQSKQMKQQNVPIDPPFELKQRIIKLVVDEIILSMDEKRLELKGALHGVLPIENNLADMGCGQ